ncbi:VOC family protein [Pseudomonas sp. SGAir0191]|uniref:VOC family protein n=1 Tax=Pseudomonas sp. SGAir0191 TaxID=2217867 RepID=UPI001C63E566
MFYERLLGQKAQSEFPSYVSFLLDNGSALGLWSTKAKDYRSGDTGHRSEIAFLVETEAQVKILHQQWSTSGIYIEQPLHHAVFGLTFVALDPDSHRLRVCLPD